MCAAPARILGPVSRSSPLDATAEPDSLVVAVDTGDRIHYLDWGGPTSALPPLVLVHGLAGTAWGWTPIARRLVAHTRVLALDLRGHGLSDAPPSGYTLDSLAFDVLTVMVANGWGVDTAGPPAVIAGHGLGAMVAVTAATLQPASVAGIALIDGGWEDLAESTGMTAPEFARGLGEPPEVLASMDAFLADRRGWDPETWDADQERASRATVDEKHAGHVAMVARPRVVEALVGAMFDYDPGAVAGLRQPVLVAVAETGSADDEVARERSLALDDLRRDRAEAGMPPLQVVRFPGAGHNLMRYSPDALSERLVSLLERTARRG
jgi:pimeloyl-ACP methyl ester carboxylesterase